MRTRFVLFVVLVGCGAQGNRYQSETDRAPPLPKVEVVDPRPGYIWIRGHWYPDHGGWHWQDGSYAPERPGYSWEQGRWEKWGKGAWHWREGGWHPQ